MKVFQVYLYTCSTDDIDAVKRKLSKPINTSDLVERIRNLTSVDWFKDQSAGWNNQKLVNFSQVLTQYGSCFSFNIGKFSDIYRVQE
jgi:hypothetical protein